MTAEQFLKELQNREVNFEKSRLRDVSQAMQNDLPTLLSDRQSVHYGLEISHLAHGTVASTGVHEWWLLIDRHLLKATAKVEQQQAGQDLIAEYQSWSLSSLQSAVLRTTRQGSGQGGPQLRSVTFEVVFPLAPPLKVTAHYPLNDANKLDPDAVLLFARHLSALAPQAASTNA